MKQVNFVRKLFGELVDWSFCCPHCRLRNRFVDLSNVGNYVSCSYCSRVSIAQKPEVVNG